MLVAPYKKVTPIQTNHNVILVTLVVVQKLKQIAARRFRAFTSFGLDCNMHFQEYSSCTFFGRQMTIQYTLWSLMTRAALHNDPL